MLSRTFLTLFAKKSLAQQIAAFFAMGEQGVWYDPSDITTLFQDSAGTTPVTALGDPVGKILDKSGRGNHATQATAASRPVYSQDAGGKFYLAFDGTDDSMATGSIDFTATDKMTLFAGVRKNSDVATAAIAELSATKNSNNGTFALFGPITPGAAEFVWYSKGTTEQPAPGSLAAPATAVLTAVGNISAPLSSLRMNGAAAGSSSSTQGTGNYGNYPLYIGRRNNTSLPFNGRIYSLIVRGAASSAAQIAFAEAYVNSKTGAY